MFAVLRVADCKNNGVFAKLRGNLLSGRVKIVRELTHSVNYYTIEAQTGRNGLNWPKIHSAAGTEAGRLLMPENVAPPKNIGIKRYD